jgi:hypothetical protein
VKKIPDYVKVLRSWPSFQDGRGGEGGKGGGGSKRPQHLQTTVTLQEPIIRVVFNPSTGVQFVHFLVLQGFLDLIESLEGSLQL